MSSCIETNFTTFKNFSKFRYPYAPLPVGLENFEGKFPSKFQRKDSETGTSQISDFPKNIFLGHTLSALSGVIIFSLMGSSFLSLGVAVGLAVFVMATFDSIHPPAGANPIIAILGGKSLLFVLMPVALGSIVIILFALFYNKLLGREYP